MTKLERFLEENALKLRTSRMEATCCQAFYFYRHEYDANFIRVLLSDIQVKQLGEGLQDFLINEVRGAVAAPKSSLADLARATSKVMWAELIKGTIRDAVRESCRREALDLLRDRQRLIEASDGAAVAVADFADINDNVPLPEPDATGEYQR